MASVRDQLRSAGIEPASGAPDTALRVECTRIARVLRERQVRHLGLLPASDDVGVPAAAIELARGLAEQSAPVGVVDARGTWGWVPALPAGAEVGAGAVASVPLLDKVALLAPLSRPAATAQLRAIVAAEAGSYAHLVVDLTGFTQLGEQAAAAGVLDGVAVVGRAGRTTVRQLQRLLRDLPPGRALGAILTGVRG